MCRSGDDAASRSRGQTTECLLEFRAQVAVALRSVHPQALSQVVERHRPLPSFSDLQFDDGSGVPAREVLVEVLFRDVELLAECRPEPLRVPVCTRWILSTPITARRGLLAYR